MFHKKVLAAAAVAVGLGLSVGSASAQTVLDGWDMQTPVGTTTDIGRLNLVSGSALVEQEVSGGNVFVGARFQESGTIFSISITKENVTGTGDIGPPVLLSGGESLSIAFTDVMGEVTTLLPGGGFEYVFTSGDFTITGVSGLYSTGSIVGIGGNAATTDIIGGINGDSTILAQLLSLSPGFILYNNAGDDLTSALLAGDVLFEVVTNNLLANVVGTGACSFDATATCLSFNVASAGDAYLTQEVPEPGALSLAALGLLGVGAVARRRKQQK